MKKCMFVLMLFFTIVFMSCQTKVELNEVSNFSLDSVRMDIAASNMAFDKSWATGDSVAFGNLYTSDAWISAPNMKRMTGTAAITGFFSGGYAWGIRNGKLTTEEVMGGPEMVSETGKYVISDSAGKTMDEGKYMALWKQDNGKWKMYRDMWNSDLPPPATAPAK